MDQNLVRGKKACGECGKTRIFYSPKKAEGLEAFVSELETLSEYVCGAELPENDFGLYASNQLTCKSEINAHYYNEKVRKKFDMGPIVCNVCVSEIQ